MSHKDLVERLGAYVTAESMGLSYQPPICHEAADEIERLREGLQQIKQIIDRAVNNDEDGDSTNEENHEDLA